MSLEHILGDFVSLTHDAIAIGRRDPGDDNARLVYVNGAFTELFGLEPEASLGQGVDIIHDPENWDDFIAEVAPKFAAGEKRFLAEARLVGAGGQKFWASISFIAIDDADTGSRVICATYRYISDLKESEQAAREALAERDAAIAEQERMYLDLDAAQTRLVSAINAYPDPFVIYDKDMKLVICNTSYRNSMSTDPDAIKPGMHVSDVLRNALAAGRLEPPPGVDREAYIGQIIERADRRIPVEDLELAGDIHHRVLRSVAENGDNVVIRVDTTELVRQRRQAAETQDRIIAALNAYPEPFAIYDADARLVLWNGAFARSLTDRPGEIEVGLSNYEVLRIGVENGRFPEALGREEEWLRQQVSGEEIAKPHTDIELAGDIHHRILRTRAPNGDFVVIRLDMTEVVRQRRALEQYAARLEAANQEITHKALHDELTGLGNRRQLSQSFAELAERRRKDGGELVALHVDLDRFKQINDTAGHAAGDHVLVETARRIERHVRPDDVVARIGGDEFVILLHVPSDSDRPERLASALMNDLARPAHFDGKECRFGASIGLARTPLAEEDQLLINSDVALYKAKHAGRGQIGVFDRSDILEMRQTVALADDIMRGLEASEFTPYYQPQVDAIDGRVVGMEALARWVHPNRGVLAPNAFLPVATDLNVVAEIDRMIFEKAIAECSTLAGQPGGVPSLSFNVSAGRIDGEEIERIGRQARSYPGQVSFELLETIFLEEESHHFHLQLDRLRELGITLEVDDFGSGRASVVALQRIGPDRLKIDRRLVAPVHESRGARRLLQSIVEIGHALEIGVTAEGIETREQAEILAEMGCDRLQGYYIARPMSHGDLTTFLAGDFGCERLA